MATNLLESVNDILAGQVADQLGSAVGLDKQQTASALKTIVPLLIGGMMKKATTPGGASELSHVLKDTDTSILDNLGGLLGGSGKSSGPDLMAIGAKLIPMLLGSDQGKIVSNLVSSLGLNEKSIRSLLSLLVPIVMAVVGKQAKSSGGFDMGALTSLLGNQKNFLANAIPSDLSGALGLSSSLAPNTLRTDETAASNNPLQWLLPLIAVGVLGYLGYTYWLKVAGENKPLPPTAPASVSGNSIEATIISETPELSGLTELKNKVLPVFEGLTSTFQGVNDLEGANRAMDTIKASIDAFNGLGLDNQSPEIKSAMSPFLSRAIERLQNELNRLYQIPGLQELIEPVVAPMIQSVQGMLAK